MSLSKEERLKVVEEFVAAVNEVDHKGVLPTFASMRVCRMTGVNTKMISRDLSQLTECGRLVLKDGLLWHKDLIK